MPKRIAHERRDDRDTIDHEVHLALLARAVDTPRSATVTELRGESLLFRYHPVEEDLETAASIGRRPTSDVGGASTLPPDTDAARHSLEYLLLRLKDIEPGGSEFDAVAPGLFGNTIGSGRPHLIRLGLAVLADRVKVVNDGARFGPDMQSLIADIEAASSTSLSQTLALLALADLEDHRRPPAKRLVPVLSGHLRRLSSESWAVEELQAVPGPSDRRDLAAWANVQQPKLRALPLPDLSVFGLTAKASYNALRAFAEPRD
jgi:hypothetical protein